MLSRLRCEFAGLGKLADFEAVADFAERADLAPDVREPAADLKVTRRVALPLRAVGLFGTVSG